MIKKLLCGIHSTKYLRLSGCTFVSHTSSVSSGREETPLFVNTVSTRSVHINVSPSLCLADECPAINITSAKQNSDYTIKGCLKHGKYTLVSYGHFKSSSIGEMNPSIQPSLGGTYTGIDEAGLLWSLQFPIKEKTVLPVRGLDVLKPLQMNFSVHEGTLNAQQLDTADAIAECQLERTFLADNLEWHEVKDGRLRGLIFKPPGKGPFPGIIDMYGTAGGLKATRAALLASCGFVTYALPFFSYQDLPKTVMDVELEYFEEAFSWFSSQEYIDSSRIGFIGTSMGAIVGIIISSRFPNLFRAMACINGAHHFVLAPIMHQGEHVPCVFYDPELFEINDGEVRCIQAISDQLIHATEESAVKVEKSKAHFLFVAGEDDQIYDSAYCASKLIERLDQHGHHNHELMICPGTGHLIDPGLLPVSNKTRHPMADMIVINGGQFTEHAKGQQQSWAKVKEFFKAKLI